MERHEELLAEHARPMYRSLRSMGMSEVAAYEGAIGRAREGARVTGLTVDSLAESFARLGLSEESARHAAGGRHSTFEKTRATEVAEIRRRVDEAKPPPRPAARSKPKPATSTKRERVSESWQDRVASDIADIEAGRRPSNRLRRNP